MPRYNQKLTNPLTAEEFVQGMRRGKFIRLPDHAGLIALLYYTGLRISEALRLNREHFKLVRNKLYVDAGQRLKHGKNTGPLPLSLKAPYMKALLATIGKTGEGERVFPYCRKTGYNICSRVFAYPHYFRLSRITNFFLKGFSIAEVRSWTGLSLKALDYYVGLVSIEKMGKSLEKTAD